MELFNICKDAIVETVNDSNTKIEAGVPIFAGLLTIMAGYQDILTHITLTVGILTGIIGFVDKALNIYKTIKSMKESKESKESKENKEEEDKEE